MHLFDSKQALLVQLKRLRLRSARQGIRVKNMFKIRQSELKMKKKKQKKKGPLAGAFFYDSN